MKTKTNTMHFVSILAALSFLAGCASTESVSTKDEAQIICVKLDSGRVSEESKETINRLAEKMSADNKAVVLKAFVSSPEATADILIETKRELIALGFTCVDAYLSGDIPQVKCPMESQDDCILVDFTQALAVQDEGFEKCTAVVPGLCPVHGGAKSGGLKQSHKRSEHEVKLKMSAKKSKTATNGEAAASVAAPAESESNVKEDGAPSKPAVDCKAKCAPASEAPESESAPAKPVKNGDTLSITEDIKSA